MPSPIPKLPALFPPRPSWAKPEMSDETIRDIQRNPQQLYGYKSGMFTQKLYEGSLLPQPPGTNVTPAQLQASGAVLAGSQPTFSLGNPDHSWYSDFLASGAGKGPALEGIPGTASNWTVENPNPSQSRNRQTAVNPTPWRGTRNGFPSGAAASTPAPFRQQTPWFQQPWGAASQETDLPWWMKGAK